MIVILDKREIIMSKKYICIVCEYIYAPILGDLDAGIEPGNAFEEIPEDWICPDCSVTKSDFEIREEV